MDSGYVFKDYYRILAIKRDASLSEIKSSFRKLAKETHPDISQEKNNYLKFILIREAYDILTDAKKKIDYDQTWDSYYQKEEVVNHENDYFEQVIKNFDTKEDEYYKDEWEYFIKNPDRYLSLFESSVKLFTASLLSILAGIIAPIFVSISLIIVISLILCITIFFMGALAVSSIIGVIIALLTVKYIKNFMIKIKDKGVAFFVKIILHPLKGIPKRIGKWILYFNYTATTLIMLLFGYYIVTWVYREFLNTQDHYYSLDNVVIILFSTITVIIFSFTAVIIFDIIQEGMVRYPKTTYIRIKVKKREQIVYYQRAIEE